MIHKRCCLCHAVLLRCRGSQGYPLQSKVAHCSRGRPSLHSNSAPWPSRPCDLGRGYSPQSRVAHRTSVAVAHSNSILSLRGAPRWSQAARARACAWLRPPGSSGMVKRRRRALLCDDGNVSFSSASGSSAENGAAARVLGEAEAEAAAVPGPATRGGQRRCLLSSKARFGQQ